MPRCGSSACWRRRRRRSGSESSAPSADGKKPGFLQRNPKLRKVVSKGQALLYIVLNGILPAIDVVSDVLTFIELLDSNNPKWAATTLAAILLPFTAKAFMFLGDLFQGSKGNEEAIYMQLYLLKAILKDF